MSICPNRFLRLCKCGLFLYGFFFGVKGKCQDVTAPRFFQLNVQKLSAPTQLISGEGATGEARDKEFNYLIDGHIRYPISLKGKTKIIGQLDYDREAVFGQYTYRQQEGEDFTFHKVSSSFIGLHDFNSTWSMLTRVKVENGTERLFPFHHTAMNYSLSTALVKNITNGEIGFGYQVSYNRQLAIWPVFKFQKQLDDKWTLDLFLPQKILVSRRFSTSGRLYAGFQGSRSLYRFRDELQDLASNTYYRRLTVNATLGIEKQLTKWVGVVAEVGATRALRSGVFTYDGGWERLHHFSENISPYVQAGIYMSIDKASFR